MDNIQRIILFALASGIALSYVIGLIIFMRIAVKAYKLLGNEMDAYKYALAFASASIWPVLFLIAYIKMKNNNKNIKGWTKE